MITITITAPTKDQATVSIDDPKDLLKGELKNARPILARAMLSVEGEVGTVENVMVPRTILALLRNFVESMVGSNEVGKQRRLLIMALMQMDDEDAQKRFVKPFQGLPIIENA